MRLVARTQHVPGKRSSRAFAGIFAGHLPREDAFELYALTVARVAVALGHNTPAACTDAPRLAEMGLRPLALY